MSRVRRRPSARPISARQSSSAAARAGSIVIRCTSPLRGGANSGSKLDSLELAEPPASSSTSVSTPVPTLIAPVAFDAGRGERGADDVAHIYVVPGLAAVAEDRRPFAGLQLAAEDRDHAGLAERVLARAVDVAEPQAHAREPVEALVEGEVALGGELALSVGGHRRDRGATRAAAAAGRRPRRRSHRRWRRRRSGRCPPTRAASSTLAVPPTLIEASKAGSATDLRTSIWAARWKIVCGAGLGRDRLRDGGRRRGCRARPGGRRPRAPRRGSRAAPSRGRRRPSPRRRARAAHRPDSSR